MKKRNIIMAAAAAMAMAMTAGVTTANALTIVQAGTAKNVAVTSIAANLKGLSSGATTSTHKITSLNSVVVFNVGDVITIKVNGAKFDRKALGATPVVLSGTVAAGTAGTAAGATWVLDATDTILTGTITSASGKLNTTDTITLTGKYDLTGVASGTAVSLTTSVSGKVLGTNQVIHKVAAGTADLVVLNTTSSLQKFTAPTKTDATATVASSFVKLDATAANVAAAAVTTPAANFAASTLDDFNAAAATGTLFVKLTGLPSNATKVDWAVTGISQSDATGTAAPGTATAAGNFWLDGAGNGFAKITAAQSKKGVPSKALVVTVDGKAAIATTDIKIAVDYIAGTGDKFVSHNVLPASTAASIVRNGSAFSVNASGALNTIKITDMSGSLTASTGKISVAAYDAAGVVAAGTAPAITPLTNNATRTIAMSTLTAAFPTAVRFDFVVESTEILASNVKKTAAGTTVSNYRNATGTANKPGNGAL